MIFQKFIAVIFFIFVKVFNLSENSDRFSYKNFYEFRNTFLSQQKQLNPSIIFFEYCKNQSDCLFAGGFQCSLITYNPGKFLILGYEADPNKLCLFEVTKSMINLSILDYEGINQLNKLSKQLKKTPFKFDYTDILNKEQALIDCSLQEQVFLTFFKDKKNDQKQNKYKLINLFLNNCGMEKDSHANEQLKDYYDINESDQIDADQFHVYLPDQQFVLKILDKEEFQMNDLLRKAFWTYLGVDFNPETYELIMLENLQNNQKDQQNQKPQAIKNKYSPILSVKLFENDQLLKMESDVKIQVFQNHVLIKLCGPEYNEHQNCKLQTINYDCQLDFEKEKLTQSKTQKNCFQLNLKQKFEESENISRLYCLNLNAIQDKSQIDSYFSSYKELLIQINECHGLDNMNPIQLFKKKFEDNQEYSQQYFNSKCMIDSKCIYIQNYQIVSLNQENEETFYTKPEKNFWTKIVINSGDFLYQDTNQQKTLLDNNEEDLTQNVHITKQAVIDLKIQRFYKKCSDKYTNEQCEQYNNILQQQQEAYIQHSSSNLSEEKKQVIQDKKCLFYSVKNSQKISQQYFVCSENETDINILYDALKTLQIQNYQKTKNNQITLLFTRKNPYIKSKNNKPFYLPFTMQDLEDMMNINFYYKYNSENLQEKTKQNYYIRGNQNCLTTAQQENEKDNCFYYFSISKINNQKFIQNGNFDFVEDDNIELSHSEICLQQVYNKDLHLVNKSDEIYKNQINNFFKKINYCPQKKKDSFDENLQNLQVAVCTHDSLNQNKLKSGINFPKTCEIKIQESIKEYANILLACKEEKDLQLQVCQSQLILSSFLNTQKCDLTNESIDQLVIQLIQVTNNCIIDSEQINKLDHNNDQNNKLDQRDDQKIDIDQKIDLKNELNQKTDQKMFENIYQFEQKVQSEAYKKKEEFSDSLYDVSLLFEKLDSYEFIDCSLKPDIKNKEQCQKDVISKGISFIQVYNENCDQDQVQWALAQMYMPFIGDDDIFMAYINEKRQKND